MPTTAKTSRNSALWALRQQLVSTGSGVYNETVLERGLNSHVWDVDGKEYIDFAGGIGTLNVGHCHPAVVKALREQAGKLLHTSFHVAAYENYLQVCERLIATVPGPARKKALLFNSGSEAVENAVKFARSYTKRRGVISFEYGFHGRTLLCLTLDGKHKPLRTGLGPFAPEIYHARLPYSYRPPKGVKPEDLTDFCLGELERFFLTDCPAEEIAAIIIEPVLGEGGFIVPAPGFLKGLRALCDRAGILLIIDEVQSGFGRTGKFWAMEHEAVVPDLVTIGKSLGGGMPISAVVGRAEILDAAPLGSVGGTYGGNPMSCAAALAVFDVFEKENLVAKAAKLGKTVQARFDALAKSHPHVGDSRGLGAMRAIELVKDKRTKEPLPGPEVKEIIKRCNAKGLLVLRAGIFDNVIRTLMPLTIDDKTLAKGLDILEEALP